MKPTLSLALLSGFHPFLILKENRDYSNTDARILATCDIHDQNIFKLNRLSYEVFTKTNHFKGQLTFSHRRKTRRISCRFGQLRNLS